MQKLYDVREAAEALRISRGKLYWLIEHRAINHTRFCNRILFTESQLNDFIESSAVQTGGSLS